MTTGGSPLSGIRHALRGWVVRLVLVFGEGDLAGPSDEAAVCGNM